MPSDADQGDRRCRLTAAYLQAYRLDHEEYPESLDDLVPDYAAELPVDPCTGKPLKCERQDDEFLLRSGEGMEMGHASIKPLELE
jgi:hypothetical protein